MDTLSIIKDILDKEMELPVGRCFAYNSAEDLPKDSNLFVVLYYGNRTPYANNVKYENLEAGLKEKQSYNVAEDIEIALISRNLEAMDRTHEVLMALNSTYSKEMQEKYHLHISTQGDAFDNSFLEATARLNRFDVRCRVIRAYEKEKYINYYDKFGIEQILYN